MANYLKIFENENDFDSFISDERQLPMSYLKEEIEMRMRQHRWILSSGYVCSGTTKMSREICQVSYDDGETFEDLTPQRERAALPIIEEECVECGYIENCDGVMYATIEVPPCSDCDDLFLQLYNPELMGVDYFDAIMLDGIALNIPSLDRYEEAKGGIYVQYPISGSTYQLIYVLKDKYSIPQQLFTETPLSSVIVPKCVAEIGFGSFAHCYNLESVVLPKSLKSIGDYAFAECTSLSSINLPSGLEYIGMNAFEMCENLPTETEDNVIYLDTMSIGVTDSTLSTYTLRDGTKFIGDETFASCSNMTTLEIPNGVVSIGNSAFDGCSSLTDIDIPQGVKTLGNDAFNGCSQLSAITVPNTLERLGRNIFDMCYSLPVTDNVRYADTIAVELINRNNLYSIKNGTRYILDSVFSYASAVGVENVTLPQSLAYIGASAFSHSRVAFTSVPSGVTAIGPSAFWECWKITDFTLPSGVTQMGDNVFNNCYHLSALTISDGVTLIPYGTFDSCEELLSVEIPNSVNEIGYNAFNACSSVTSVTIEEGVSIIGDYAFGYNKSLSSLTIPNSVTEIGEYAFTDCPLTSLTLGSGVTYIGECAFNSDELDKETVRAIRAINRNAYCGSVGDDTLEVTYYVEDGSNLSMLYYYMAGEHMPFSIRGIDIFDAIQIDGTEVSIADIDANNGSYQLSVGEHTVLYTLKDPTVIGVIIDSNNKSMVPEKVGATFMQCGLITNVNIPDGVEDIGVSTFAGCSGLTSVTIPNSVTSIGRQAFFGCSSLTSVTIPNSVTNIGQAAFYGTAWYDNQPNGLVYAGKVAIAYKGTMPANTSISLQEGTLGIGEGAFESCSNLTSVTIPNSVTNIGSGAFGGCSNLTSVTISNSVTSIDNYAFSDCALTSVTIPNSVTEIKDYAFANCPLTRLILGSGITTIGECITNSGTLDSADIQAIQAINMDGYCSPSE